MGESTMTPIKRIEYMDTARALCMVFIVAYWHLCASIKDFGGYFPYAEYVVIAVLSTFTYLSGYFMAGKVKSVGDIRTFYFKRLQRFYPLYCIACLTMFVGHIISKSPNLMNGRQLAFSLVGLSCIVGPSPTTLWYFSMIMLFYIITPIIAIPRKTALQILIVVTIFVVLVVACYYVDGDYRILIYYPLYVIGLLSKKVFDKTVMNYFGKVRYFIPCVFVLVATVKVSDCIRGGGTVTVAYRINLCM